MEKVSVTNPTAGDVHVNVPLTNFSQRWMLDTSMYVSLRAFPNVPVAKQSDLYWEFDRDDFLRDEAKERADGAESEGSGFTMSTNPYFTRVYAIHKDVTDRQRANADNQVRLDESATRFVMQKLMIRRERLFADAFFGTGIWANDAVGTTDFEQWSEAAGSPIQDFRMAKSVVQVATGYRPNRLLIGREAWDTLLDSDDILSRITGGATTGQPARVQRELVAALLEVDTIEVMDGIYNAANRGAEANNVRIGGDDALLYYAPMTSGGEEPTAGTQFSWTGYMGATENGQRIKRFRMEANEADRIEGQMAFDYKVIAPELGYYFSDVTADA